MKALIVVFSSDQYLFFFLSVHLFFVPPSIPHLLLWLLIALLLCSLLLYAFSLFQQRSAVDYVIHVLQNSAAEIKPEPIVVEAATAALSAIVQNADVEQLKSIEIMQVCLSVCMNEDLLTAVADDLVVLDVMMVVSCRFLSFFGSFCFLSLLSLLFC